MHFVYIIKSQKTGRYYVGESADPQSRLVLHNDPNFNKSSTKSGIPWEIILTIQCQNRSQAIRIERHIKRMKSKVYIENLRRYPEMSEKLLTKYN